MDVAGALLPFTQVVRPELTIHVQEVLTQADKEADGPKRNTIPQINEPSDKDDEVSPINADAKSVHINKSASREYYEKSANGKNSEVRSCDVVTMKNPRKGSPAWWLFVVLPPHGKKHVHFEATDKVYYFWIAMDNFDAGELNVELSFVFKFLKESVLTFYTNTTY